MILTLLVLSACTPQGVEVGKAPTVVEDSGDSAPPPVPLELSAPSWRLHEEITSIAYVSWTQNLDATVHVEYSFDPDVWETTPSFAAPTGTHEQILVGIPYDHNVTWRVVAESGEVLDGEPLLTGELPGELPVGDLVTYDPDRTLPEGRFLLTSINQENGGWTGGDYWTIILDRQARVVWAHLAPQNHWTLYAQVSVTGDHFLWDEANYWSDWGSEGERSEVHRTWLDEEIEVIATPGLHHAFVELPDGTLAWGSQAHGGGEALVEKAPGSDEEVIIWTCEDAGAGNRCESNCVYYDEGRNSYLYSFYTNSTLYEVDRATGRTLWWAGEHEDGYKFNPEEFQFSWQHGAVWTEAGTLLLSSEHGEGRDSETWALEYEVDHDNGSLNYIWGSSAGTEAETNGDTRRLTNGNTLHMVGSASVIREIDPDGEDVWVIDFHGSRLLGRGEFISDLYNLVKPREEAGAP